MRLPSGAPVHLIAPFRPVALLPPTQMQARMAGAAAPPHFRRMCSSAGGTSCNIAPSHPVAPSLCPHSRRCIQGSRKHLHISCTPSSCCPLSSCRTVSLIPLPHSHRCIRRARQHLQISGGGAPQRGGCLTPSPPSILSPPLMSLHAQVYMGGPVAHPHFRLRYLPKGGASHNTSSLSTHTQVYMEGPAAPPHFRRRCFPAGGAPSSPT